MMENNIWVRSTFVWFKLKDILIHIKPLAVSAWEIAVITSPCDCCRHWSKNISNSISKSYCIEIVSNANKQLCYLQQTGRNVCKQIEIS